MMTEHFTIVSKSDCPWCTKAKDLLESRGYTYQELNIDENPNHKVILREHGFKTVPQIWQGPTHIGGYTDLEKFLTHSKDNFYYG